MEQKELFHVKKPGIMTTFQDMGRTGYQRFGVPVSGAMDPFALQVANILVGNPRDTVALEVTLIGPTLEVLEPMTIAITGANLNPKVNNVSVGMWKPIRLEAGDVLTFGQHHEGVRAYIAVSGGVDAPTIFGSKSTDMKSGFGSMLEKGTVIKGDSDNREVASLVGLSQKVVPTYAKSVKVGVIEGPHTDLFTEEGRTRFFDTVHVVDANSNRMGYRLASEPVTLKEGSDIFSDAIPFGGIQIPRNGQPIILMADRQTTGGYPRIGTVISADIPKLAQLVPKGEIQFYPISVEEAQDRYIKMEQFLYQLEVFRRYV
ncbi:5-oxoprolinase subunit C family protein [Oceanobacillus halotolerans]|uniref:5-oxoprolinase subunit C family protein n=1 Tax=Oceanobacillus halotolerans TaxID=2663380 RepID=UPI0013DC5F26|nr:biotin-dependent carboxyltransferase family protein [Oceanobacillus halotolerans]